MSEISFRLQQFQGLKLNNNKKKRKILFICHLRETGNMKNLQDTFDHTTI